MRLFFILLFFTTSSFICFGQKLKSDGYTISIKSIEKQKLTMFGKEQEIHYGVIKVKSKDDQAGEYRFYFPKAPQGEYFHLTIRSLDDLVLEPRLYYNKAQNSYTYTLNDEETIVEVSPDITIEDLILSGTLIWLKLDK